MTETPQQMADIFEKVLEKYFNTHHPCRICRGFVPDGAIKCIHCEENGFITHDP